VELLCNI